MRAGFLPRPLHLKLDMDMIKLKTIFHRFFKSKMKDWLIGPLFLGVGLYLLRIYAKGQWKHTIQFLKSWITQAF